MSTKVINWGIIGAGKIAAKFATDLQATSNSKLYAIASRSLSKAEEFALDFKADKAFGDYESLVLETNIDAIYIATPHSFHKAHTILCLNNNKPVLCEKPFAMNLLEVNGLIKVSKEKNILLMEALWTAFLPHFQYVQNLLKNKHFGNITRLEADFGFHPPYNESSRLFDKSVGGGSLLDIGIYPIFAALWTLGRPNTIEANAQFFDLGSDSECLMTFKYEDAEANLKSTLLEETNTEAIFHCEKGTIKINGRFHEPSTVTLIDKHGNSELKSFNYKTIGYSFEIEHFNQLIREGKTESDIMTFERSRELIKTLDDVRSIIGLKY
ncbi:Gfo/Idh/MocA family oxidoreductase [Winogradskyella echinorum]|uniref:Gfo/Idh/MocA family oxidoreductase n=1 Tax=Winogradskyella echinorum TaxID=538189 RepID=A0ABR6Y209_9FLAO|nr:Gfo/Idh/MocA family oxidoreductase [Winogradskyella echinorum]MBC3846694.1 Gfo/Idh/MocA family oxidoreductase [Winogradskyella echinorum]MBC5751042.1 Gfo/Idh/MocA family oxidoreductase [Winogradskyella echinorum]